MGNNDCQASRFVFCWKKSSQRSWYSTLLFIPSSVRACGWPDGVTRNRRGVGWIWRGFFFPVIISTCNFWETGTLAVDVNFIPCWNGDKFFVGRLAGWWGVVS